MKTLLIVPRPLHFLIAFLALGMAGWWGPELQAAERMALVIGNGAYRAASALPNPPEDARLVGGALRSAGFEVTEKTDVSLDEMRSELEKFQEAARVARASAVALYYAGHGMEVKGANYLIPVDAEVKEEYQITSRTLPLAEVMGALDNTQAALKIVVLDCCRDNPLGRSFRRSAAGGGLAVLSDTPEGTIIAYATSPNRTALDGTGKNSPFASAFSTALAQPGLTVEDVFKFTIGSVKKQTNKEQQPWLSLNYEGRFLFLPVVGNMKPNVPGSAPPAPAPAAGSTPLPGASSMDNGSVGKTIQITLPSGVIITLCYCPAGSFMMGSPASEDEHQTDERQVRVTLSQPFWMAQTEVTQGQWKAIVGTTPSQHKTQGAFGQVKGSFGDIGGLGSEHPMYFVSAAEADDFVEKLNANFTLKGWHWAIPTEAQWEYACRAGTTTPFSFGAVLNGELANCDGTYKPYGTTKQGPKLTRTCEVKSFNPNEWGLYDMHGNLAELCLDAWDGSSKLVGGTDPVSRSGHARVARGGSWMNSASACRSAKRNILSEGVRDDSHGFRVVVIPSK